MKKVYELTLGKKLANAQSLAIILADFENFKAPAAHSLVALNDLIADVDSINKVTAAKKLAWEMAIADRNKLYSGDENSISNLLAPIKSAVKAQYGISSRVASSISTIIRNMRGRRGIKKLEASDVTSNAADQPKTMSRSHHAKGSIAKDFSDIVETINQLTPAFDPGNEAITMTSLKQKQQLLVNVANRLVSGFANWKITRASRDAKYITLKECVSHIREAIKAQYGTGSAEYTLIKPFAI